METDVKNYTKVFQMSIFVKHTSDNLHKSGSLEPGALFLEIIWSFQMTHFNYTGNVKS